MAGRAGQERESVVDVEKAAAGALGEATAALVRGEKILAQPPRAPRATWL
jgi:hypothetical protein